MAEDETKDEIAADDWAAALAEQATTTSGEAAPAEDVWAAARAEQAAPAPAEATAASRRRVTRANKFAATCARVGGGTRRFSRRTNGRIG
jgi:hypothetical protein